MNKIYHNNENTNNNKKKLNLTNCSYLEGSFSILTFLFHSSSSHLTFLCTFFLYQIFNLNLHDKNKCVELLSKIFQQKKEKKISLTKFEIDLAKNFIQNFLIENYNKNDNNLLIEKSKSDGFGNLIGLICDLSQLYNFYQFKSDLLFSINKLLSFLL